jgi:hypothetical protein
MRRVQPHFVLYGYPLGDEERETPMRLKEATVLADDVSVLRQLAEFFTYAADQVERHGSSFGHEHFADFVRLPPTQQRTADIIVSQPPSVAEAPEP